MELSLVLTKKICSVVNESWQCQLSVMLSTGCLDTIAIKINKCSPDVYFPYTLPILPTENIFWTSNHPLPELDLLMENLKIVCLSDLATSNHSLPKSDLIIENSAPLCGLQIWPSQIIYPPPRIWPSDWGLRHLMLTSDLGTSNPPPPKGMSYGELCRDFNCIL